MANTTFSGPVRSENGFEVIKKSASTGAVTSTMSLQEFTATITVGAGDTTGKESSIQIPTNFILHDFISHSFDLVNFVL